MNPYQDARKWGNYPSSQLKERSDTIDYLSFGKKVFDKVVLVPDFKPQAVIPITIDLSPALENGIGHVGIVVVPTLKR